MEGHSSKLVPPLKLKLAKDSAQSSVISPIPCTSQFSLLNTPDCKATNQNMPGNDNLPVFENNAIDAAMEGIIKAGAQLSQFKMHSEKLAQEKAGVERENNILESQVADLKNRESQALSALREECIKSEQARRAHAEELGHERRGKEQAIQALQKERDERKVETSKMNDEAAKQKEERDRERAEYKVNINKMTVRLKEELTKVQNASRENKSLLAELAKECAETARIKKTIEELRKSLDDEKSQRLRDREEFLVERKKNHDERISEANELRDIIAKKNEQISDMIKRWDEETANLKNAAENAMKMLQADIDREIAEKAMEKRRTEEKIANLEEERTRSKTEYEAELSKTQKLLDEEKKKAVVINKSTEEMWQQIGSAIASGGTRNPAVVKGINTGLRQQLISNGYITSLVESSQFSDDQPTSTEVPTSTTSHINERAAKRKRIGVSDEESN